jgi:hypothetical protein
MMKSFVGVFFALLGLAMALFHKPLARPVIFNAKL